MRDRKEVSCDCRHIGESCWELLSEGSHYRWLPGAVGTPLDVLWELLSEGSHYRRLLDAVGTPLDGLLQEVSENVDRSLVPGAWSGKGRVVEKVKRREWFREMILYNTVRIGCDTVHSSKLMQLHSSVHEHQYMWNYKNCLGCLRLLGWNAEGDKTSGCVTDAGLSRAALGTNGDFIGGDQRSLLKPRALAEKFLPREERFNTLPSHTLRKEDSSAWVEDSQSQIPHYESGTGHMDTGMNRR